WPADRTAGHTRRARHLRRAGARRSAQLDGAADADALDCANLVGRQHCGAASGHASVRAAIARAVCDHRRTYPRGDATRLAGGQLVAGRWQQGHLDRGRVSLMLSRAAESLYWMARYLERAENTARLINATQQLL